MDLDLAIQNTLRRSPMDSAMHGVLSNFGGHYELKSYTENAGLAQQLFGESVGITAPVLQNHLLLHPLTKRSFLMLLNIPSHMSLKDLTGNW